MAHAFLLGAHVEGVVFVGGDFDGHVLDHLQPVGFESDALDGVVGDEAHFGDADAAEDLCAHAVVALVSFMAEVQVGLDGVHAFVLQLVGVDLVHQPDAAALLVEVDHHAAPFFFDHAHSHVELLAAVAAQGAEDVARHAGGVYTHQHGFVGAFADVAFDQRRMLQPVALLTEGDDAEGTVFGGQLGLDTLLHERLGAEAVGDQVTDGDDLDVETFSHLHQLWHAGHGAVLVEDFDQCTGGIESGQARHVDGGLGVSGATQHTARTGPQRVDVPRPTEVGRFRSRIGQCADGLCAVVDGDARSAAHAEPVDGDGEGRF